MGKIKRLSNFMFILIPITILNGIRMICYEDVCVDEIFFEVSKPRKDSKKLSKSAKKKIVKEYLNDCWNKSMD